MHVDQSALRIVAHLMIAFLFLYRGLTALPRFADHAARMEGHNIPFPRLFAAGGFATMLVGGTLVGLDYHAAIGAWLLIFFTALANLLYHHFWSMDDPRLRQTHTWIFCNNIAVMGGLLLVSVT